MPKWTEYTTKDTLADNDEVMLYDATARANKRGLMSKFWDYVVDKMSTAVISKLETNNKTIIGAINALNSEWNVRHQQLLDNDKYLNEQFINVFSDSAAAHNSIYRGKNLTNVYTVDKICQRISAGTFKDLYVGDYFDISITTDLGGAETVRCILAGFDVFWNNGDTAFTKHHAVIVPKDCFKTKSVMNDTNVTTGGYVGSKMYKTVLPVYAAALQTALNNHILSHRELLTTAVSTTGNSNAGAGITGYASNWEWKDCLVKLMSEIQVYGSTVLSSSFYDTGCDNIQFPLFRLAPNLKVAGLGHNGSRRWYWLSAVVSAAAFALCSNGGGSSFGSAAGGGGVRPYFCIG